MGMWHRLLLFLKIRNEFDWAPPGLGPEVNHPYQPYDKLPCCVHCGGGRLHPIHLEPFDARRMAEIEARRLADEEAARRLTELEMARPEISPWDFKPGRIFDLYQAHRDTAFKSANSPQREI